MRLDWKNAGRPPAEAELDEFERIHGVRLTDEHRWFLKSVVNGGRPRPPHIVPTTDCPGGAACWDFAYGINHPMEFYDLGRALRVESEWELGFDGRALGKYVPFGGDDCGGVILIDVTKNVGQVVYNPRDPYEFYYSADSIHHFLETLIPVPDD